MLSGYGEATSGPCHATSGAREVCHLISGHITITPDGGTPVQVKAGQAFVIKKDFRDTWHIHNTARKHVCFRLG